jgi:hypothetical protein
MNKLYKLIIILTIFILSGSFHSAETTDSLRGGCPVVNFYYSEEPQEGVKVLTMDGELEEADLILYPGRVNAGSYEVALSRVGLNLYRVDGKDLYLETRSCYEYSTVNGLLKIESTIGITKGTIYFE